MTTTKKARNIHFIALALGVLMLSGCLLPPILGPSTTPRPRRTIVVFHGLGQTAATFATMDPYASLLDGLKGQGWNVIVPAYASEAEGDAMATNILAADPVTLRDEWVAQYDRLGLDGPVFLLGISWGGLVATNIAAHAEHSPDGIVLHLPALDPNYLTEFTGRDMSAFTDYSGVHALSSYVSWALDDTRVGCSAAAELAARLGSTAHEYAALGHTTNGAVVADLLAYTSQL